MRIVIIEDVQDVVAVQRMILEKAGHEVIAPVLFSGVMDEDFWKGVDVALVDLTLPGLASGKEILSWLKQHVPNVWRVCCSASKVAPLTVDANVILEKPFTVAGLLGAVDGPR